MLRQFAVIVFSDIVCSLERQKRPSSRRAADCAPGPAGNVFQHAARNPCEAFACSHSCRARTVRRAGQPAAIFHSGRTVPNAGQEIGDICDRSGAAHQRGLQDGQKFEVVIENDSLRGDQDDIEVSFHTSKDSQAEKTPFMPRVVFSMKMEWEVWTLHDIAITINLPLADPQTGMKACVASIANSQIQAPGTALARQVSSNPSGDSGALAAMREIVAAETAYAATYPAVGYTCTLSDLDGFGAAEVTHAMPTAADSPAANIRGTHSRCQGARVRPTGQLSADGYPSRNQLRSTRVLRQPIQNHSFFGR